MRGEAPDRVVEGGTGAAFRERVAIDAARSLDIGHSCSGYQLLM